MTETAAQTVAPAPRVVNSTAVHLSAFAVAYVSIVATYGDHFATASAGTLTVATAAFILGQSGRYQLTRVCQLVLVIWYIASPLLSFYVRFPEEKSMLTFDRIAIGTVVLTLLAAYVRERSRSIQESVLHRRSTIDGFSFSLTPFEIAWTVLTLVAVASVLAKSNHLGFAGRTALDAFALPVVLFYVARRHVEPGTCRKGLYLGAVALALFLVATGAYELVRGDLFQVKGSELIRGQETRVNGPFATDSSFAVISVLLAVFLRAAPSALGLKLRGIARLVHVIAVIAAIVASLFPAYRGIAIALLAAWATYEAGVAGLLTRRRSETDGVRRHAVFGARTLALGGALALILIVIVALSPGLFERRLISPGNLFSRVATWEGAARVARDNPLFGVGLWNFTEHFETYYHDDWSPLEVALDTRITAGPHSNVLWIASELGLVGLIPYLCANLFLLIMGVRAIRRASSRQVLSAAACFLALLAGYWVAGLGLVSGIYSDLNLYFFFLLGLLSGSMSDKGAAAISGRQHGS
ncbi:MAG TPA: O-antigen ligase family protein [Blastocatellia bacterium]|nr:O-antigen ligase family protein [Blastocatellia bacterium]